MTTSKLHCDHECVCSIYESLPCQIRDDPCSGGFICKHDTRRVRSSEKADMVAIFKDGDNTHRFPKGMR